MWPARTHEVAPAPRDVGRASARPAEAVPDGLKPVLHQYVPGESRRNLFAFPEAPVVRVAKVVIPAPQPQQPVVVVVAAEPAPPAFPYRYIGSFGPREVQFAAFARNGEVINARPGETIGGFRLMQIGLESVEVSDGRASVRVPLGR